MVSSRGNASYFLSFLYLVNKLTNKYNKVTGFSQKRLWVVVLLLLNLR
jgi:hypothetical protein